MCRLGYTCTYQKLVQAVVTLYMSPAQFNDPNTTRAFLEAIAAAAGVTTGDINIVSVADSPDTQQTGSRRLLQSPALTTHVQVQVYNAIALNNLDQHLENAGLGTSAAHNWFSPHSVQVRRLLPPL
jgi:hypothetical protein